MQFLIILINLELDKTKFGKIKYNFRYLIINLNSKSINLQGKQIKKIKSRSFYLNEKL